MSLPATTNGFARLLRRPSPGSTTVDLISQVVTCLNVHGGCFLGKFKGDGEIVQLGVIPPASVDLMAAA